MRQTAGVSLIEMLIALAIIAIVFFIASMGMITGMRTFRTHEDVVAAQSKLRRVSEVLTQDLRGSLLGSLLNVPYTSDTNAVSFLMLRGGAGFPVLQSGFGTMTVEIPVSGDQLFAADTSRALLVQGNQAIVMNVASTLLLGDVQRITFSCGSGLAFNPNTVLFEVDMLGYRYDDSDNILYQQVGAGPELPVAFDIGRFDLEYVYVSQATNNAQVFNAPRSSGTTPLLTDVIAGETHNLERFNIILATQVGANAQVVEYKGQINLNNSLSGTFQGMTLCN